MRQFRVSVKRRFVQPHGIDRKRQWLPEGFEQINAHATGLLSGGIDNPEHLLSKLPILTGPRFKSGEKVNGHNGTSIDYNGQINLRGDLAHG
jgi:hypothetical protein